MVEMPETDQRLLSRRNILLIVSGLGGVAALTAFSKSLVGAEVFEPSPLERNRVQTITLDSYCARDLKPFKVNDRTYRVRIAERLFCEDALPITEKGEAGCKQLATQTADLLTKEEDRTFEVEHLQFDPKVIHAPIDVTGQSGFTVDPDLAPSYQHTSAFSGAIDLEISNGEPICSFTLHSPDTATRSK